jgi:hypothetical protein
MNEALPGKLLEKLGEGRRKVHGVARPSNTYVQTKPKAQPKPKAWFMNSFQAFQSPAVDKAVPLLDHDSLHEMTMLAETQTKPKAWKVFISWRMSESLAEVNILKKALEARGVEVILLQMLAGGDLLRAVSQGMADADMFVIMGTKTYGKRTAGLIGTNNEMQHIITSKKPYLLLNMNPESSCLEFEVLDTNHVLNLKKEPRTWERWEVGQPMDDALPDKVLAKLRTW